MKRALALIANLALVGGLFAGTTTTSAHAAAGAIKTDVYSFMFMNGKWTGSIWADRRLCVDHAKVTIYKVVDGGKTEIGKAPLNTTKWANLGVGTFSFRPPAMDIKNRKARLKALRGTFMVKLPQSSVSIYGKSFTCAEVTEKVMAAV